MNQGDILSHRSLFLPSPGEQMARIFTIHYQLLHYNHLHHCSHRQHLHHAYRVLNRLWNIKTLLKQILTLHWTVIRRSLKKLLNDEILGRYPAPNVNLHVLFQSHYQCTCLRTKTIAVIFVAKNSSGSADFQDTCLLTTRHLILVKFASRPFLITAVGKTRTFAHKMFPCPHCDYKFYKNSELKMHMVTHSDVKPYACPHCEYKCKRKRSLTQHLLTHSEENPSLTMFIVKPFIIREVYNNT